MAKNKVEIIYLESIYLSSVYSLKTLRNCEIGKLLFPVCGSVLVDE